MSELIFLVMALISIASAVLVVESEEIFHAALFLAPLSVSVAGLFYLLAAEFLAAIQILIYAGAVIILVLFAIALTKRGVDFKEDVGSKLPRVFILLIFIFLLVLPVIRTNWLAGMPTMLESSTAMIGNSLFADYVIPFEIASVLLLAALIGGIFFARKEA